MQMLENTQNPLQNQDGDDNFQRQSQPAAAQLGQLNTTLEDKYDPVWIRPGMSIVTRCALLQQMPWWCMESIFYQSLDSCGLSSKSSVVAAGSSSCSSSVIVATKGNHGLYCSGPFTYLNNTSAQGQHVGNRLLLLPVMMIKKKSTRCH